MMNIFALSFGKKYKLVFAILIWCLNVDAMAQTAKRQTDLRSLIAAEQSFAQTSADKGTREAFIAFLADEGVIFNPLPTNGKKVWLPREKPPGVLTWMPVFADISAAGDLGFTTGPYEFRRAAGEKPVGHGYYMSVWQRNADGAWKVLLDIGTRNAVPKNVPSLQFPSSTEKRGKKKADLENLKRDLQAADEKLSQLLFTKESTVKLNEFVGDYFRVHRMNEFPLTEKNTALAALASYQGLVTSQTISTGVAQSGDFGYSYGTYTAKELNEAGKGKFDESGSFARIWRRDEKGKWKVTLIVMHAAPPAKRSQ